ncbi:MAG: hypothetical protein KGZ80_07135 [Methylomonas sp.]|nr:hypothetical protein [Methylomonas sp.]PPD50529.1 MAG: hypothetical protein CTY13_01545 [Methylobacter sp.]PPD53530.1 MAG: hypothetical protein CTY12_04740 [Methylotenera sp.]
MQSESVALQSDDQPDQALQALCKKIDFLFLCMKIHREQFFALTESYVDRLAVDESKAKLYNQSGFFGLIEAKDSYESSVNAIRSLLKRRPADESATLPSNYQLEFRHQLVLRIAADVKSARRWSRLLRMYITTSTDGNGLTKRWRTEVDEIKRMTFLEHTKDYS